CFFQAEDGIRDFHVTGVQTCALPIFPHYPTLFIRDGDFVYATNKDTGEITNTLSLGEYVMLWRKEFKENPYVNHYYTKGLFQPRSEERRVGKERRSRRNKLQTYEDNE